MSCTPLYYAMEVGDHGVVSTLLKHKADPNIPDEVCTTLLLYKCKIVTLIIFGKYLDYRLDVHLYILQLKEKMLGESRYYWNLVLIMTSNT
jgi:ankyrin repeat protein